MPTASEGDVYRPCPLVRRCRRFWDARFLNGHHARRSSQLLRRGMCGYASVEVLSQRSRRQSLSRLFGGTVPYRRGLHSQEPCWGLRARLGARPFSTPSPAISRTRRVASDSKRLLTAREACTDRPFSPGQSYPPVCMLSCSSESPRMILCAMARCLRRTLRLRFRRDPQPHTVGDREPSPPPGRATSPLSSVTIFLGRLWGFVTG